MNLFELIGILIGDGCLLYYPKHGVYGIEISGNASEEIEYYKKISKFIENKFKKTPRIYVKKDSKGTCLKLVVYGKHIAEYLMNLGIKRSKTFSVKIPKNLMGWHTSKHILRGIFETDGCLYFSKSKKIEWPSYPRLEIRSSSHSLIKQAIKILNGQGFKTTLRKQNERTPAILLSGNSMLEKWRIEIGFSSSKNETKYLFWKKFGYYKPGLTLKERLHLIFQ